MRNELLKYSRTILLQFKKIIYKASKICFLNTINQSGLKFILKVSHKRNNYHFIGRFAILAGGDLRIKTYQDLKMSKIAHNMFYSNLISTIRVQVWYFSSCRVLLYIVCVILFF